ncbi:MAG: septum formation initiator family protein [Bryobacteraceae bacterium]|nr:septum formation initiator family protein [Bryobacteraceae bacterium]
MKNTVRNLGVLAVLGLLGGYVYLALQGPQGIPALMEKRREIRELEEQNQNLKAEIERRKERIRVLTSDPDAQELEIRRRLKLQREGDTSFFLPQEKTPSPAK